MSNPSKAKGDWAEREAAALLTNLTGWPVKRKLGAGRAEDTGDLHGVPNTTVQVKYRPQDIARAIREGVSGSRAQQKNGGTTFGVALIRRPRTRGMAYGDEWVAVMDLHQLCTLLREATHEWPDQGRYPCIDCDRSP